MILPRIKQQQLLDERKMLGKKKMELIDCIKELKIPHNLAQKFNRGAVSDAKIEDVGFNRVEKREKIVKELNQLEKRFLEIKNELAEINIESDINAYRVLREILYEILTKDQMRKIGEEIENRMLGLPPTKVPIGIDDSINQKSAAEQYKKLAKDSIEKLISARKSVSKVIENGMSRFDKGYFLQVVSPLNKELPTVNELEMIKRKNHL